MYPANKVTEERIREMSVIQLRALIADDPRMADLMDVYDRGRLQEEIIRLRQPREEEPVTVLADELQVEPPFPIDDVPVAHAEPARVRTRKTKPRGRK